MATKKPSRPDDERPDDDENAIPAPLVPNGFSPEILAEYNISPTQTRGTGFVHALGTLLNTRPNMAWTRESLTAELETITGRRPSPGTLDRIRRAAMRAGYLADGTHKTTGARVWLAPPRPGISRR
jgi:hypothetical protein